LLQGIDSQLEAAIAYLENEIQKTLQQGEDSSHAHIRD